MPDSNQALAFLKAIGYYPPIGLEIRCFVDDKSKDLPPRQIWPGGPTPMWPEVVAANEDGYGIFVGVNPRARKSGDADSIEYGRLLWVDLDGKDFDKGDIEHGKELALEKLRQALPDILQPAVIVDSAHGFHAYWNLVEPVPLREPTYGMLYRNTLRSLAVYLGGDTASAEPARVLRLPGTDNWKGGVAIPCKLIECHPDRLVNLTDFDDWCPAELEETDAPFISRETLSIDQIRDRVGRNNALTSLAGSLRRRGVSEEVILASIRAQNERFDPPLPEHEIQIIARSTARYKPVVLDAAGNPEKGPPQTKNVDLERLLIACVVSSNGNTLPSIAQFLQTDDMSDTACSITYGIIIKMMEERVFIDAATVNAKLRRAGDLAISLSLSDWLKQEDVTDNSNSIETYAKMLLDMAQSRRLMGAAEEMSEAALRLPPDKAQEYSLTLLQDLSMRRNRQESGDVLDAMRKADSTQPMGFTTGIDAYDFWSRGYWPGSLHALGGYRGTGKTGIALGRMIEAARDGARVIYFSNETPAHILVERMRGYIANVDWRLLLLAKDEKLPRWAAKQEATLELMRLRNSGNIMIFDRQRSISSIRMMVLLKRPDVIFVDYLQHLVGTGGARQKEYERITECSLGLQEMANQEQVSVTVLSQISIAQANAGYDGEVTEFKGSGSIVADSTISILLQRLKKSVGKANVMKFLVIKNQVGQDNFELELLYDPSTARLSKLEGGTVEPSKKSGSTPYWVED
jgi:replicative DNA helicase